MTSDKRTKAAAVILVVEAIYDCIKANPEGLPSGHLYARLMGRMSLETYQGIIDILVAAGKITKEHNLLKAKG